VGTRPPRRESLDATSGIRRSKRCALRDHERNFAYRLLRLQVEVMQRYSNLDAVSKTLQILRTTGLISPDGRPVDRSDRSAEQVETTQPFKLDQRLKRLVVRPLSSRRAPGSGTQERRLIYPDRGHPVDAVGVLDQRGAVVDNGGRHGGRRPCNLACAPHAGHQPVDAVVWIANSISPSRSDTASTAMPFSPSITVALLLSITWGPLPRFIEKSPEFNSP
jgi:hypothetical protein